MPEPDGPNLLDRLRAELGLLESQAQMRRLEVVVGVDFSSHDYLGLSTHPALREAVIAALGAGTPVASTGSRLLSGNAEIWMELESELARFAGTPAALFFNSGYAANLGLLGSILRPEDTVFSDSANHASLIDGIRLSRARKVIFPHLDLMFLEDQLRRVQAPGGKKLVVVESLFSMEGDRAPLVDLVLLAERYGAEFVVDEAHATGVIGPRGRGLVATAGMAERVLATVHSCGKALAAAGAYVACSEVLKQYLVNRARTFIFSTALPPYLAAQVRAALKIAAAADEERNRLAAIAGFLRARLQEMGFDVGRSDSQIIPVLLGPNEAALRLQDQLCRRGFVVRAIRPPTVPPGTARLRLSVNANLAPEVLVDLVDAFREAREALTTSQAR